MDKLYLRLLLVEDDNSSAELVISKIKKADSFDIEILHVGSLTKAVESLGEHDIDLILLDLFLPDSEDIDTFASIHKLVPDIPVIILTSLSDEKKAIKSVQMGAQDYLPKSELKNSDLTRSILYALERQNEINKRKKIEKALEDEKERLAVTLHSIGDGVIATDTVGKVVLMNKVAEELTGWPEDEAVGTMIENVFFIIEDESGDRCENPVLKAINENGITGLKKNTVLISRERQEFNFVSATCSPIHDRDGIIIGVVLVFRDISQRKKMEEELLRVQKLESLGVLAGGIAHDFNNFLTAIIGNITLTERFTTHDPKAAKKLNEAQMACNRAKELASQLLSFSRGNSPIKKTTSDFNKLIGQTVKFATSGSHINYDVKIDDDIWPVEIDEGQISQVISNMVINAAQSMPNGGKVVIRVSNTTSEEEKGIPLSDDRYVKITVEDEGIGIPKEYITRVFDPYFTTKKQGSGLGLATSYTIVHNHDGYISVDSELEVGTMFHIYLPATEKTEHSRSAKKLGITRGSGKILVMDDKDEVREATGEMLENIGYTIVLAKDGEEALTLYEQAMDCDEPFDSIIIDLTVPGGMGGTELLEKLFDLDPEVKAILTSGYSHNPVLDQYKKYGFKGVLTKPYELEKLSKVIHGVLLKAN